MRVLAMAAMVALGALAPSLAAQGSAPAPRQVAQQGVVVEVHNERDVAVTVFLKSGPFDRRLAVVPARSTRQVTLPDWATRDQRTVRLVVHADGDSQDVGTRVYSVQTVGRIAVTVPATGRWAVLPGDTMSAVLRPEELAGTTITVENPRDKAVTVYAERHPFDYRLGRVPPRGKATFQLPRVVVGPDKAVKIFLHPDHGTDLASERLYVKRGEHLGLRVPRQ